MNSQIFNKFENFDVNTKLQQCIFIRTSLRWSSLVSCTCELVTKHCSCTGITG